MDLGAFCQIENLEQIMKDNNIYVPRLRGLRLMKDEKPITKEEMDDLSNNQGMYRCEQLCRSRFKPNARCFTFSSYTDYLAEKYLEFEERNGHKMHTCPTAIKWDNIHGKKRKAFKYVLKQSKKRVYDQYKMWNKYCGREDVLYIHARIGGGNWAYYRDEVENQPWFLEKVDDAFDSTYCDIFAKIGE